MSDSRQGTAWQRMSAGRVRFSRPIGCCLTASRDTDRPAASLPSKTRMPSGDEKSPD